MYFNTIIIETRFIGQLFVEFLNNLFYLKKNWSSMLRLVGGVAPLAYPLWAPNR